MDIIEQVKKIEASDLMNALVGFVGIIAPGILTMFMFKRDLFITLDLMKLILLSASISIPIVFLNIGLGKFLEDGDNKYTLHETLFLSLIISAIVVYPSFLISYLAGFSFRGFVFTLIACEAAILLLVKIADYTEERNQKVASSNLARPTK